MILDYFKRLFGFKVDPTVEWSELPPATPTIDLRTMQVGPLSFWDPIAKGRELGRPDLCQRVAGKVDELVYARAGFLLEFYRGRFSYAAFMLSEDGFEEVGREHEEMVYCRPKVILPNGEAVEFSPDLELEALVEWLGKPESADVDDEESVILWRRQGTSIEAELNARGRLKRFNLYPVAK
jgi:hypothetical protein